MGFWNWLKSLFAKPYKGPSVEIGKPPEMSSIDHGWEPPSVNVYSPRKLQKQLELIIDQELMKIAPNALRHAVEAKDANMIVGLCGDALSSLKVREKTNNNDGELVELIQKTGGGVRGYAWCMYQQQTQVAYAEKKLGIVSKMPCSGACADVRASVKSKASQLIVDYKDSKFGDVWIWMHKSGNGHTGNFKRWIKKDQSAELNEGNTTAGKLGDKIVREGGGSYRTERAVELSSSSDMRLMMVVRPF